MHEFLLNKAGTCFVLLTVPPTEMLENVWVNDNYKNKCFPYICGKRLRIVPFVFKRIVFSFELEAKRIS